MTSQFYLIFLAAGVDGLEYTREWLDRSYEALEEQTAGQSLFSTTLTDIKLSPANILHGAYMELLNWTNNIFPEVRHSSEGG